jgi:thioesterase domain-containing protein
VRLTGREATEGPPVFLLPGVGGNPIVMRDLARRLAPRRVYSTWPHGYMHRALPDQSVTAIARRFVAALTEREPDGPIVLGGFSFGSYVTFEMARQLRAAGRAVPLLVIFDTDFLFDTSDGDRDGGAVAPLEHYARRLHHAATDPAAGSRRARFRRVSRMIMDTIAFRVDRAVLLTTVGILRRPHSEQGRAFVAHHARVLRFYRPKGYGGRALVVVGEHRGDGSPDLGWRGPVTGPVDSVTVPGTHMTVLREPQVEAVARAVAAAIDRSVVEAP